MHKVLFCSFLALAINLSLFSAQRQEVTKENSVVRRTKLGPIVEIEGGRIGRVETESSALFVLVPFLNPNYVFIYQVPKNGKSGMSKRAKIVQLGNKKSLALEIRNNDDYEYIRADYEKALKYHGFLERIKIGIIDLTQTQGFTTYSASDSHGATYVYRINNTTKEDESFVLKKIQESQTICKISKIRRKPDAFSSLPTEYKKQRKLLAEKEIKEFYGESKS